MKNGNCRFRPMVAFREDEKVNLNVPKLHKHLARGLAAVVLNGCDCYLGPHGG